MFNILRKIKRHVKGFLAQAIVEIETVANRFVKKDKRWIFFFPHANCMYDGYDILNGESDNVLILFNSILKDERFNDYHLCILYYHHERLQSYMEYIKDYYPERVTFVLNGQKKDLFRTASRCANIFFDTDYQCVPFRVKTQHSIVLNYFGGFIKDDFKHLILNNGGFEYYIKMLRKNHRLFDCHLSISDICSKFIALDDCHYYGNFLSLGFPRNDLFFLDNSALRKKIEALVDFPVKRIITYVPTHRDYENKNREKFYDETKTYCRSIWGHVTSGEQNDFEQTLADTQTLVIAKVHPQQEKSIIQGSNTRHVIFYSDIAKKITTSLNPILSISDSIITDYTTTVYDYLYTNRPIIYYFYDIEDYRASRGFFIEPIESICAGHLTYNLSDLSAAIRDIAEGKDPYAVKRGFLRQLFIKYSDGDSTARIKDYFFKE